MYPAVYEDCDSEIGPLQVLFWVCMHNAGAQLRLQGLLFARVCLLSRLQFRLVLQFSCHLAQGDLLGLRTEPPEYKSSDWCSSIVEILPTQYTISIAAF